MQNFQVIVFRWPQAYSEIFKPAFKNIGKMFFFQPLFSIFKKGVRMAEIRHTGKVADLI